MSSSSESPASAAKPPEPGVDLTRPGLSLEPPVGLPELEDERVRSAHLVTKLAEVERERDESRREADQLEHDRDAARGELTALRGMMAARDARAMVAQAAAQAAEERAAAAEKISRVA